MRLRKNNMLYLGTDLPIMYKDDFIQIVNCITFVKSFIQ